MTTVTVSAVNDDDIDALVTSVAGLFSEDAGQHDTSVNLDWPARDGAAYYTSLMADPHSLLLLARDGDQVIGHLVGRLTGPNPVRAARIAELESMRVAPGARRAGIGSLLVRHFITWAREHGAQQARVTAYTANHTAQRLYARHGFTAASVTLRATL